jgi:hypothetical protein
MLERYWQATLASFPIFYKENHHSMTELKRPHLNIQYKGINNVLGRMSNR